MSGRPLVLQKEDHVLLKVRASPGASRDGVSGVYGDALKVSVTAPPEKGKANRAICRVLARKLGLSPARVCVASGETSREKWIRIDGADAEGLRKALS